MYVHMWNNSVHSIFHRLDDGLLWREEVFINLLCRGEYLGDQPLDLGDFGGGLGVSISPLTSDVSMK